MKKLLLTLLTLCLTHSAFAETVFAIGGGLNLSTINTEGSTGDLDPEPSVDLALKSKMEIDLSEKWKFRSGLWFQQKSARLSYDELFVDGTITFNTLYVSVPLNVQYQAFKRVGFFGGYIADIRINDYIRTTGDLDGYDYSKDSKSIVHIATAGISILAGSSANIDVSWQQGLTDVYKDAYKIHTFSVDGYYRF